MLKVNSFVPSESNPLPEEIAQLIERRKRLLGPAYQLFYNEPLHLVEGKGAWLFDADGGKYLDLYNNIPSVGHSHPEVVNAIAQQSSKLVTHTRYLHEGVLDYAEQLLSTMPSELGHLMLTCTGSESNDLALRIAKDYTGGTGVIVTKYAYHGMTSALAALSPSVGSYVPVDKDARVVAPPPCGETDPSIVAATFAKSVRDALADMKLHGIKPAALLVDSLFTSDGVFADPPGFLAEAAQAVHDVGALFISDEVQPGFGRTGTAMWGFQRHNLVPDIVTMGKPMGNGYPMAGVAIKPSVLEQFGTNAGYFNTFGGNPAAAAAGLAVLKVIKEERLMENANTVGNQIMADLRTMASGYPTLGTVRGTGLYIGMEVRTLEGVPDGVKAKAIINALKDRGILLGVCGSHHHVLRVRPPLCVSSSDAEMFIEELDQVMRDIG